MAMTSIENRTAYRQLKDERAKAEQRFNSSAGDEQAAARDQISFLNGKMDALDEQLNDILAAEDKMRQDGGVPITSNATAPRKQPKNVADMFLGARDEFEKNGGLMAKYGEKISFSLAQIRNEATFGLNDPKTTSYELPSNIIEMPMGVIDVISKGVTTSNLEYMVPGTFNNKAKQWKPGEVKAESSETWKKDEASLFTIAHHMPISKHTAFHYPALQSIIGNDLLYGLKLKEAEALLNLDDGDTKKGILKKNGIQTYTNKAGDNLYDSIRRMKTLSWMKSGYAPTHVALHPQLVEELDLLKDANGVYLRLNIDNKAWALPIVEDVNLVTDPTGAAKYGALVFNAQAATWYTSENDSLTMGLVNDQFTRNEYTLLAEGEHLITVQRPQSFVYLADAMAKGK